MTILNTFVIEDGITKLGETLGLKSVEFTPNLLTDDAIDEWLTTTVFGINSNIGKLIIPVRLGNDDADYLGLRVGLHIRLTKNRYDERFRFIPLIFTSVGESMESILGNQILRGNLLSAILLFTKGSTIVDFFDLDQAVADFNEIIDKNILENDLLKKLVISDDRMQGHRLANEWGVFRLAKFAGIELTSIKLPTDLFFKYRFAKSEKNIQPDEKLSVGFLNNTCKALLIDDCAEKGWKEILNHILHSHVNISYTNLEVVTTFEDADDYRKFENKDIVFLDLRLKPEEDRVDEVFSLEDLSGLKLLRKIKLINKGIQVIVLTASNKAWNMKAMLDEGADGYFIKESPEIPVSDEASKINYEGLVRDIKEALKKGYLKKIYKIHQRAGEYIDLNSANRTKSYMQFYDRAKSSLDIAFELLKSAAKDEKYFNLAYLTYYQILEDYANQIENFQFISKTECYVNQPPASNLPPTRVVFQNSNGKSEWALQFVKNQKGYYFEKTTFENDHQLDQFAKISFLLAFKHQKGNVQLKSFGIINKTRNEKAAHVGTQYVSVPEILEILKIVELFLTTQ